MLGPVAKKMLLWAQKCQTTIQNDYEEYDDNFNFNWDCHYNNYVYSYGHHYVQNKKWYYDNNNNNDNNCYRKWCERVRVREWKTGRVRELEWESVDIWEGEWEGGNDVIDLMCEQ